MKVNEVYCGECADVLQKEFPDNCVDLIVTSPPYDDLREYDGKYVFDFNKIAIQLSRVIKDGGVIVWVVADETKDFCESLTSFKQAIFFVEECGLNLLDTMIYEKANGPAPYPGLRRYPSWFEYMFIFSKGRPKTFNPISDVLTKSGGGKLNKGMTSRQPDGSLRKTGSYITKDYRMRHNVWRYDVGFNKDTKDKIALKHPARFPEQLARDHILTWSNPGDVVLDPMCGSGTTLKMAKMLGRKWVGIDINPEYVDISRQRVKSVMKAFL